MADQGTVGDIEVTSKAFEDGEPIPARHTGDGEDVSPPLTFGGVPEGTESLVLICDDPDAPRPEPWVHWMIWNVPADRDGLPENVPKRGTVDRLGGARQGSNDFGKAGYGGPAPPKGHGTHRYRFTLYALSETLDLDAGANRDQLEDATKGKVLDSGRLVGTYER